MDLRVIIPVKPFAEAKQRLASVLNPVERAELAERMFCHVLGVAIASFGAANIAVVSRSQDILAMAEANGAIAVHEADRSDLNSALSQAVRAAAASRVLVTASDLPLLESADLAEMARSECAIAPDRHQAGTNALMWPVALPFAFGDQSFTRHVAIAADAYFAPLTLLRPGLAHDVDVPDDLNEAGLQPNRLRSRGSTRSAYNFRNRG